MRWTKEQANAAYAKGECPCGKHKLPSVWRLGLCTLCLMQHREEPLVVEELRSRNVER